MFRPAFVASTLAAATAALALGACSPQDLASAGDSSQAVGMVAMANQTLPDPSEQALAPICAAPDAALIEQLQQQLNAEREGLGKKPVRFRVTRRSKKLFFVPISNASTVSGLNEELGSPLVGGLKPPPL